MSGIGGILTGTLALAALEAVITTAHGQELTEVLALPGAIARWWMDPARPLIPDRRSDQVKTLQAALGAAYSQALTPTGVVPAAAGGGTTGGGGGGGSTGGGIKPIPAAPPRPTPPIIAI